jgi:hypothetical protein
MITQPQTDQSLAKRELAERLNGDDGFLVWVDPRVAGVRLPFRFEHLSVLVLPVGRWRDDMDSDLQISGDGLSGTWHFGTLAWACRVPWEAVLALAGMDGQGVAWQGDLPPALRLPEPADSVPLPPGMTCLIVNGQALVGEGWWRLELGGKCFPGVRWMDVDGGRVRLGGQLEALMQHFPVTTGKRGRAKLPRFNAFLGYASGSASYESNWLDCSFQTLHVTSAEFGGREYHFLRVGHGPGLLVWLREWLVRLGLR